jgi:hypothetical protein
MRFDRQDESYAIVKSNSWLETSPNKNQTSSLENKMLRFGQSCQFWLSIYAPYFFGKACLPKNIFVHQNYLRTMVNNASTIYIVSKGDKNCTGRDSWACSRRSWNNLFWPCWPHFRLFPWPYLRIRCNLFFCVLDKPEEHHLGCMSWILFAILLPSNILHFS